MSISAFDQLLSLEFTPEDVSILIGENGSGKSTLLNDFSKFFTRNKKDVIGIANSIHDKFYVKHKKFKVLRGRAGRRQTTSTIKNALKNIAKSDEIRLKNVFTALEYVDFEPTIGLRFELVDYHYYEKLKKLKLTTYEIEEITYIIDSISKGRNNLGFFWLRGQEVQYGDMYFTKIFLWETLLVKIGAIKSIEVFLKKKGAIFSILEASSGELSLITSIVYLATAITERTIILIDEPENSLHPKWQKEYVKTLLDLFYFYQPKIIIATHSPLIVNGAELFVKKVKIYKSENFSIERLYKEALNVEEIYYRLFDITTPKNRFLSDYVVRYLNLLAAGKISIDSFKAEIDKIEGKAYDPEQINVLDKIKELASNIGD